jgi:diguanylate cyclase (GGDEF)-like protein
VLDANAKLLGYVAAALFFFMALMLLLTLRRAGGVRGARHWLNGTLVIAAGVALNTAQGAIPPFLGLVVSNVMIVIGAGMNALGSFEYRFPQRTLNHAKLITGISAALLVAANSYFLYVVPGTGVRVLILAIVTASICSYHAWILLLGSPLRHTTSAQGNANTAVNARFEVPHMVMVIGLILMIAVFIIRIADTLQNFQPELPPGGTPRSSLLFYSVALAGRLMLLIGMVLVIVDELEHALRTQATRDPLTGLLNRRGFFETAKTHQTEHMSLFMLDLDDFKAINDEFGHDQGDHVIALFARCLQSRLPPNAVVARMGGEEFCALLPNTPLATAQTYAEDVRTAFAAESIALNHARAHTVSIGVSTAIEAGVRSVAEHLEHADRALYQAKRSGRNRVELSTSA